MYQGLLFNIIYNLLFVLTGYIMHFFLGSVMTPVQYGIVGTIITILDFEYLFLNNGVRQSISKELSKERYNIRDLILKSLFFQIILIAILFSVNFFGAPLFANLFNDNSFSIYLKYVAFIIPINGLYVLALGINDGLKKFVSSAWIGIFYALAKLSVIPFVLYVFVDSVIGTIMGFLFAISVALVVGIVTLFKNKNLLRAKFNEKIQLVSYVHSVFNFSLFFIIVSVVLSIDTLIVKSIVSDGNMAGFYTGAVNFAKVTYFLLSAFFTIILPVTTTMYVSEKLKEMETTVKEMLAMILAFILPIASIISASSGTLLSCFYNPSYKEASVVLSLLAFSHFFMGITVMLNMIISSTNEKRFSGILAVVMLFVDVVLCIYLTTYFGIIGTAIASIICTAITMAASIFFMKKKMFNVFTSNIIRLVFGNLVLWGATYLLFKYFEVANLFILILVYAILYLSVVGLWFVTGLVKKDKLYFMIKNRK